MEWISIKTKLPERFVYPGGINVPISPSVLCTDGQNFWKANYAHDRNKWFVEGIELVNISHWMIPSMPCKISLSSLDFAKRRLENIHAGSHMKDMKEVIEYLINAIEAIKNK